MICKYFLIFITCKGILIYLFFCFQIFEFIATVVPSPVFLHFPFTFSLHPSLPPPSLSDFWFRLASNPWSSSISFWMLFHFKCLCTVNFFSLFILFYLETFEWLKKPLFVSPQGQFLLGTFLSQIYWSSLFIYMTFPF